MVCAESHLFLKKKSFAVAAAVFRFHRHHYSSLCALLKDGMYIKGLPASQRKL